MIEFNLSRLKTKTEKEGFLALMNDCLTPKTIDWLEWKYFNNPNNLFDGPIVIIAKDSIRDKIIGIRPLLLGEVVLKDGTIIKSAQPCDTAVHPKYQGQGIFSNMNKYALKVAKENNIQIFFNFPNFNSQPGYLKMGWKIVSIFNESLLFNDLLGLAKEKSTGHVKQFGAYILSMYFNRLSRTYNKLTNEYPIGENSIRVSTSLGSLGGQIENLWKKIKPNKIRIRRNVDYLQWRFFERPDKKYTIYTIHGNNELQCYAICTFCDRWGIKEYQIVDYCYTGKSYFYQILCEIIRICIFEKVAFVSVLAFTDDISLREYGFFRRNNSILKHFVPQRNFIVRGISEEISEDIYNIESWDIRLSDTDTY